MRRVIHPDELLSWSENLFVYPSTSIPQPESEEPIPDDLFGQYRKTSEGGFTCNKKINEKIKLVLSSAQLLAGLDVDAVVVNTTEGYKWSGTSLAVVEAAGIKSIEQECSRLSKCHAGEARNTSSGALRCHSLIHTVGPRYTDGYYIASENALHSCYKNSLLVLLEESSRSIAFPCIYERHKSFPRLQGAHVALRTIRMCLEQMGEFIDSVVLYFDDQKDLEMYKRLLVIYCPRDEEEERLSKQLAPRLECNKYGEATITARQIKIRPRLGESSTTSSSNSTTHDNTPTLYNRTLDNTTVSEAFMEVVEAPETIRKKIKEESQADELDIIDHIENFFQEYFGFLDS